MDRRDTPTQSDDGLSPLAHQALGLNAGSAYTRLVVSGPGDARAAELLGAVAPAQLLVAPARDEADAQALLAGLWLWHDWLDRSHTIAQGIHSPTGSFWHAIMHRREGDFDNSKYWYAHAKGHPMISVLAAQAAAMLNPLPPDRGLLRLLSDGGWSPEAFVDLVREVDARPDDPRRPAVVALQQTEWRVLFDHCARQAAG